MYQRSFLAESVLPLIMLAASMVTVLPSVIVRIRSVPLTAPLLTKLSVSTPRVVTSAV